MLLANHIDITLDLAVRISQTPLYIELKEIHKTAKVYKDYMDVLSTYGIQCDSIGGVKYIVELLEGIEEILEYNVPCTYKMSAQYVEAMSIILYGVKK